MIILETILMVMEYPLGTLFLWSALSYAITGSLLSTLIWTIVGPLTCLVTLIVFLLLGSQLREPQKKLDSKYQDWIEIIDPALKKWEGQKIPMRSAYEWYFRGRINFKRPTLEIFMNRYNLFRMVLTLDHIKDFLYDVLYKAVNHERDGDKGEVAPVYNLGNDYYYAFLSDPMFYSSGVAYDSKESLEVVQARKCGIVAESLQLKDGDRILDFGCGWGSWLIYCAQNFNVQCHGLTISQCQFNYATARIKKLGLEDKVHIHLIDYREMTPEKFNQFDKITCFEMSEHVGIRNYQNFMAQVKGLLKDDGLFYLQIAGLRRAWQYEDLIWGVFMGKYIFPGADASCPLYWDVNQLERGGFEVHHVRNQGCHYAHTIESWYHNIVENQEKVIEKYDQFAYRRHELFLAWSTMIARQGSSTVWCIVSAKNHQLDAYSHVNPPTTLNRTKKFINREFFNSKF
jgi:cyclopropane fatty-acyl-phospholipid synthase-like methyltransferase